VSYVRRVGHASRVDRPGSGLAERLWRVRKNHTSIDAHISDRGVGVEIRYFYDGEPVLSQQWPTRQLALTDAAARLRDLQRAGWTTHW
jgi:hypothetical protein